MKTYGRLPDNRIPIESTKPTIKFKTDELKALLLQCGDKDEEEVPWLDEGWDE